MPTTTRRVPGTVIHHSGKQTQKYIGCPSIQILADGSMVSSQSYFGPGAANTDSFVYRSVDGGATWERVAHVPGSIWSNLFAHHGDLYLMGTDHSDRYGGRFNGRVVIRRSSGWRT